MHGEHREDRGELIMVWYERYSMAHHWRIDLHINGYVDIVFDAYGDLNGVIYNGVFRPIKPQ